MFDRIKKAATKSNTEQCKKAIANAVGMLRGCDDVNLAKSIAERFTTCTIKANSIEGVRRETVEKIKAHFTKQLAANMEYIDRIAAAEYPTMCKIEINYTKGGVYGAQACAELWTGCDYYKGRRTSGCGYDKASTAAAYALNKSPEIMRVLFEREEKRLSMREKPTRREFIGYGCFDLYESGYFLPHFDGGIGISSTIEILRAIGFAAEVYDGNNWILIVGDYNGKNNSKYNKY